MAAGSLQAEGNVILFEVHIVMHHIVVLYVVTLVFVKSWCIISDCLELMVFITKKLTEVIKLPVFFFFFVETHLIHYM
jgi:hypothetical protein